MPENTYDPTKPASPENRPNLIFQGADTGVPLRFNSDAAVMLALIDHLGVEFYKKLSRYNKQMHCRLKPELKRFLDHHYGLDQEGGADGH